MMKLVLVVVLVGCGGSGMEGDDEPPTDGSVLPPEKDGWVTLAMIHGTTGPNSTVSDASLVGAEFRTSDSGCTSRQIGACTVSRCVTPPQSTTRSAGTITITGLASPVTLVPGSDKMYEAILASGSLFGNGEVATVRSTGADVAAFTGTVITPRLATFTSVSASMTVLSRSTPLEVTWTGGSGDVQLYVFNTSGQGGGISCRYPAATGSATVGTDVLSQLSEGSAHYDFSTTADGDAGDVGLSASFAGMRTDQSLANDNLLIQ